MVDAVLDTGYWIEFEKDPSLAERFRSAKKEHEFNVLFTRPNFSDLVKRPNQDVLSEFIAEFTDEYVVVEDYTSDQFRISDDPILLAPPGNHEFIARQTVDFGVFKTLRYLFRIYDQNPDDEMPQRTKALNRIYRELGEDALKLTAFWGHREEDEHEVRLDPSDASGLEYIMRMLIVEHGKQVQQEEKIQPQDYLDLRICANAIYTSDIFLSESKWVNQEVIPKACSGIEGLDEPVLVSSFEEFFNSLSELL